MESDPGITLVSSFVCWSWGASALAVCVTGNPFSGTSSLGFPIKALMHGEEHIEKQSVRHMDHRTNGFNNLSTGLTYSVIFALFPTRAHRSISAHLCLPCSDRPGWVQWAVTVTQPGFYPVLWFPSPNTLVLSYWIRPDSGSQGFDRFTQILRGWMTFMPVLKGVLLPAEARGTRPPLFPIPPAFWNSVPSPGCSLSPAYEIRGIFYSEVLIFPHYPTSHILRPIKTITRWSTCDLLH